MEHYYVIVGNEFGVDPGSKTTFKITEFDDAESCYDAKVDDNLDLYVGLMHVDADGKETTVKEFIDN